MRPRVLVALVARVAAQADVTLMVFHTGDDEHAKHHERWRLGRPCGASNRCHGTRRPVHGSGHVIEIPTPDGKTADDIVAAVATCQFRGVLETSWSGDPVGLSDVEVSAVCKGAPGTNTCGERGHGVWRGRFGGLGDSGARVVREGPARACRRGR